MCDWRSMATKVSSFTSTFLTSNLLSLSLFRYCYEWVELIDLFADISTNPSIMSFCQQPYHLSVVSPNPSDPVTQTGNVVENGAWQLALVEDPWLNGTRLTSADAFHKSILNGVWGVFCVHIFDILFSFCVLFNRTTSLSLPIFILIFPTRILLTFFLL